MKSISFMQKGRKNINFGKTLKPKWDKYKGIWMRSSWEIAYAKYLDKLGIKWLYESKTFDLGNTTYTPDFYLLEKDLYIEIKGFASDIFKKKFKNFKRKFPKENIKMLMQKELKKMSVI